jgi:uncharacterized protein (TIGR02271 family)
MKRTTNPVQQQTSEQPYKQESHGASQSTVIPVVEEQLQVSKQVIETGKVRVSKSVHEEEVTVDVSAVHDEIDVERIEVNQYVETPPPPVRYEGDTMIIPILREVEVVEKRLMLVEEVHVTKRRVETNAPQQIKLRKEEVTVERIEENPPAQDPESNPR